MDQTNGKKNIINLLCKKHVNNIFIFIIKIILNFNPHFINKIKNKNLELELFIINNFCFGIRYIKNPSKEAQIYAVKRNVINLIDIKEPCKEAQVYAIENYSWILHSFRNPCSEAIDALIKKDDMTYLRYVEHIPAILQIKMIKKSIFNTCYIKNQDVQLHEYILKKNNSYFFNHIKNPSEDIVIKMLESLNIKPYKQLVFIFSQYLMFSHLRSYFKNEISKEVQCKVIKKVSPEIAEFVINSGFCNEAKQVYEKIKLMRDACE